MATKGSFKECAKICSDQENSRRLIDQSFFKKCAGSSTRQCKGRPSCLFIEVEYRFRKKSDSPKTCFLEFHFHSYSPKPIPRKYSPGDDKMPHNSIRFSYVHLGTMLIS